MTKCSEGDRSDRPFRLLECPRDFWNGPLLVVPQYEHGSSDWPEFEELVGEFHDLWVFMGDFVREFCFFSRSPAELANAIHDHRAQVGVGVFDRCADLS